MKLSTHYYVLLLSEYTSRLFEGFRDTLIDIRTAGFPCKNPPDKKPSAPTASTTEPTRKFFSRVDERFSRFLYQDPLWVVLVGEQHFLSLFQQVTTHGDALIGFLPGDYTTNTPRDLGSIVWPIIKKALAGSDDRALFELEAATESKRIAVGIAAVEQTLEKEGAYLLFVEEAYQVKSSPAWKNANNESIEDPADILVERVLSGGGNVVFLDSESMIRYQRIALVSLTSAAERKFVFGA
jgi:Bacterial archaeo-eukaryotic release factor family 3